MARAAANRESENAKADKKAAAALSVEHCLRCGEPMVETYCKSICTNCGYMRDCNDQW